MADTPTATDFAATAAAAAATPQTVKATYTPTHAAVKDGEVTLQGCKRDTDGVMFVSIARTTPAGETRTTYDRADRVARYVQLLAQAGK